MKGMTVMSDGIVIKNLTSGYEDNLIIEELNVAIPKGKITVVIGANGSGKSTLLKTIARVLKPKKGEILLDGFNVHQYSSKNIAKLMAVLPQGPKAPSGLTVEELVAYGRFPHKKGFGALDVSDREVVEEALDICGMKELRDRTLANLSGGQHQRAWIAMTLCQKTDFILLDEPTTYLDLAHQLEILTLLAKLNQKEARTIVMVLHELNMASRFADYIIGMKEGKIVAKGPPVNVITSENLRQIYQIEAEIMIDEKTQKPFYLTYENISLRNS